ncbi:MAG: FKBP-type peptidyl-prolyl cis-trans isomerase [Bacteroidota bacterium]
MIRYLICILLGACTLACSNSAPATAPEKDAATRAAIEERLIGELSPSTDRAGQERNAIINRAIDQLYDVQAAPEGYFYEILTPGEFGKLVDGDIIRAHYQGRFLDGTVFDDSRKRGKKLRFFVGELIPAWNLGLQQVRPGGAIRIITPSELAYGAEGLTGPRGDTLVPAHTVLEFVIDEIELLEE